MDELTSEIPIPRRAPSIVCDDVDLILCDDIDLGEKFASECSYVAGDPINLRDPWGLEAQEQGVHAKSPRDLEPGECMQIDQGEVCRDKDDKSGGGSSAPELDAWGCPVGAAGEVCRKQARQEFDSSLERDVAKQKQKDDEGKEPGASPPGDDDGGWWDGIKTTWNDFIAWMSPGSALVDLSNGMHPGGGAMRPGDILDRSHAATEGAVLSALPGPEGIVAGSAARRLGNAGPSGGRPALHGDPYHPDSVGARVRPPYTPNPAHDPRSPHFDPRKTPEPADAASVYEHAARADMGTWYGEGAGGWYRYSSDNAGGVHFSGIVPEGDVPINIRRGR